MVRNNVNRHLCCNILIIYFSDILVIVLILIALVIYIHFDKVVEIELTKYYFLK